VLTPSWHFLFPKELFMAQDYTDSPERQHEYENRQEEKRNVECDWCKFVVDYWDAYGCHSVKGKQFCSTDCANNFDEKEYWRKKNGNKTN